MQTNAKVNTKRLENIGIVHKIGKATDVTTGIVPSPEYYDKVMEDSNREYLFLVKVTNGKFSKEGDSGSLVFCRSRSVQQTHVDIVGKVYANNLKLMMMMIKRKMNLMEMTNGPKFLQVRVLLNRK